jgi:4-amino-4-deoxy-L-arabinose transferase-like glycosyltransferase
MNKYLSWLTILGLIFLGIAVSLIFYSYVREFHLDEFEHIHTSWKILQGHEIYVDFFQHHHPLFYYLLTPIIYFFGETTTSIFACRYLMLLILGGILIVTYFLSIRLFIKSEVALISIILTSTVVTFFMKSIEVRPDVPQALMSILSIYFLFVFYDDKSLGNFLASAVCLAISFLFLQKTIVVCLVIGILFLYDLYRKEIQFRQVLLYLVFFLICISPLYIYHLINGTINQYFVMNWLVNIDYPKQFETLKYLSITIKENIITFSLFLIGVFTLMKTINQRRFAILSMSLIISILLFKNPTRQFFLIAIPTIGIISSYALYSIFKDNLSKFIILICAIYVPLSIMHDHGLFRRNNTEQLYKLDLIEYVLSITKKTDKVYDEYVLFNLFRDDIGYFWYCVGKNQCLDAYKKVRVYDYDVYNAIALNKPKVISTIGIDNLDDPRIKDFYEVSDKYTYLLIRRD